MQYLEFIALSSGKQTYLPVFTAPPCGAPGSGASAALHLHHSRTLTDPGEYLENAKYELSFVQSRFVKWFALVRPVCLGPAEKIKKPCHKPESVL